MNQTVLQAVNICKKFTEANNEITILKDVSFSLHQSEMAAIIGTSGSGKSTLLHILGGLDSPTAGDVIIDNVSLTSLSTDEVARFRNQKLGFVYQFHHLMSDFTALENVMMPLLIAGVSKKEAIEKSELLLEKVGLKDRLKNIPSALSGGERQRVAIARSLINDPKIVLADEPTGNLDQKNSMAIFDLLCELNQEHKTAFLLVTHDNALAQKMDKIFTMQSGNIIG